MEWLTSQSIAQLPLADEAGAVQQSVKLKYDEKDALQNTENLLIIFVGAMRPYSHQRKIIKIQQRGCKET